MAGRERPAGNGKDGPGAASFRVQRQIRRNAQDMQEYLTELGSWEKSVKKKDRKLSRRAIARSSSHSSQRDTPGTDIPPIRLAGGTVPVSSGPAPRASEPANNGTDTANGGAAGRRPGEVSAANNNGAAGDSGKTKSSVSAAGHTYDKGYSKWAKFDIDAALRSVDTEGPETDVKRRTGSDSNSDSDTDGDDTQEPPRLTPATLVERSSSQRRRCPPPQAAGPPTTTPATKKLPRDLEKEERERGNTKFGQGDFEGAVKSYTRCLDMNSKSSLAFSNRAMAYLKLKEFGKAEADSDSALRVDSRHVKSLQRRAVARNALGKHRAALADLQTAAEIDPSSKQVRKDLSKTLETLKTVVRRAPKRQVKVESVPLPAPKPRGYSLPIRTDEGSPRSAHQASLDPAPDDSVRAVSATNSSAPVTGSQETAAPFSSVLRQNKDKHASGESNVFSYQARTTVEELPEEAEAAPLSAPLPTPVAPTTAVAPGRGLPSASNSAAPQEGRAMDTATDSSGIDTCSVVSAGLTRTTTATSDTAPAGNDTRSPKAPGAVAAEVDPGRPAASAAAEPDHGDVGAKQASNKKCASGGGENNMGSVSREARGGKAAPPPPSRRTETKDKAAPVRTPQQAVRPSTGTRSPGPTTPASQLPTTGYQFEHMWRSTGGSPESRLELLRAVPPSSVVKFFRRTPIEVDLLGGVLRDLGEAFLPRRPATALRWLKSLSKASRFGVTVALLGEADGRAAAREVLARLEAAPAAKVDPQDVVDLRKHFLL